jgi:hypothetical protein
MKENKANKQLLVSARACKGREAKPIWLCVRTGLSCTVRVHDMDVSVPVAEPIFKLLAGPTRHPAPWFWPRTHGGDRHGTMEGYPCTEDVCIGRWTRAYTARVHQLHHASSTRSSLSYMWYLWILTKAMIVLCLLSHPITNKAYVKFISVETGHTYLHNIYCKVKQWIQGEVSHTIKSRCACVWNDGCIWWLIIILLCSLRTYLLSET